jgi:excisionase family DNA binding protein
VVAGRKDLRRGSGAAGQWPTPEAWADRLVDALNDAAESEPDEVKRAPSAAHRSRPAAERAVYTVKEVAYLLGLHLGGAYELLRDGTIPAERIGRRWIISRVRFHAWLDGIAEEET